MYAFLLVFIGVAPLAAGHLATHFVPRAWACAALSALYVILGALVSTSALALHGGPFFALAALFAALAWAARPRAARTPLPDGGDGVQLAPPPVVNPIADVAAAMGSPQPAVVAA